MNEGRNPRARAITVLTAWEKKGGTVDSLIEEEQRREPFGDHRDSQLFRAIVYGVARWLGYLDLVIGRYSSHPLAKMKPLMRQALRTGLFQLLFMERIPDSAAINETVNILKNRKQPRWLTGFANGLLRKVGRETGSLPIPGKVEETAGGDDCDILSHPGWLYGRWCKRYGRDKAISICQANNLEPVLCLRVQHIPRDVFMARLVEAGFTCEPGKFAPDSVIMPGYRGQVPEIPGYADGHFQVQDEAAQLVTLLLGDLSGQRYLDGCAGLGGKTTHMASIMPPGTKLTAVEPERRRAALLEENLFRAGLADEVTIHLGKLQDLAGEEAAFDGILLDAPCSGLGVIRRHPDIRWNRSPEELERYADRQRELLGSAAMLLTLGGVLVYVTCSTEPEENEQVVASFLGDHQDFTLEDCRSCLPKPARVFVDEKGFFRSLPDQGLDGFFAARLKKVNN